MRKTTRWEIAELSATAAELWREYLATPGADPGTGRWVADRFGDSAELATDLCELVLRGVKRATAPCVAEFLLAGEPIPVPGDHLVVLDGLGRARCIVRTTRVTIRRYEEVDAAFAALEGEGDGSLAWWRREHLPYYQRVLAPHGLMPTPRLPVVCEEFERVYLPADRTG
ncbi:MAG: ASCH domain-containing protein [Pseudomonadota bacterium]